MNVFKIALHNANRYGLYEVSIPNYPGGDVVPYETARDLQNEVKRLREQIANAQLLLSELMQTLKKPNEPKRIN